MSKINTYEELVAERRRLESDLLAQKAYIKNHVNTVREKLEPLSKVINFVGGLRSKPGSTLLKLGSDVGINLIAGQKLRKAGWLAKLVLPFAMKLTANRTIDKIREKSRSTSI